MRLDIYMSKLNNIDSRTKAKKLINGGFVQVNDKIIDSPSYDVDEKDIVKINLSLIHI